MTDWPPLAKITGDKRYELANHLGNVFSVVSDKKIPKLALGSLQYFNPDIKAYNDYYPFGMLQPHRHSNTGDYRYGFNGKEMDDEVMGEGNSINYTFRMHDPRVGRFFAVDPLFKSFPWYSPYQFNGNTPIMAIELEGLEPEYIIDESGKLTEPVIALMNAAFGYEGTSLKNTKWSMLSDFTSKKGRYRLSIKQKAAKNAIEKLGMGAITLGLDVVYSDSKKTAPADYWLRLISHEQSHVQDYKDQGTEGFIVTYGLESFSRGGYGNETTEDKAYMYDEIMSNALKNNSVIICTLEDMTLSMEEKKSILRNEGLKIRLEVIDSDIKRLSGYASQIMGKIDDLNKKGFGIAGAMKLTLYQDAIDEYRRIITQLHIEKEIVKEELENEK